MCSAYLSPRRSQRAPVKRFILWDNDGVLVDTEHWYFTATKRALAELGFTLERDIYLQRMVHGESSWDIAIASGLDEEQAVQKRKQRDAYYQEYLREKAIDIPGVEAVLKDMAKTHSMAIVTTSKRADFELIHRERNLVSLMDFVLVREDYKKSKPDTEPYLVGIERFGANPEECLVVEDSQRGLQAALAAGLDCAIVHNDFTASHDFTGACFHMQSLEELPKLLKT